MSAHVRRPHLRVEPLEDRAVPATLYVATTGTDAPTGGSAASPWRTLQYAANRVAAGDTVVVRAGDYTGFHLTRDGTAASRITFAADPGVRVTARNATTPDGINLEGADYVTIQGFTVNGMPRTGIRTVLNKGVVIQNNSCDQNEKWGILTGFSDDVTIQNNVCTRSKVEHGIYVSNSGDRPVVRGNTLWGNRANGLHMNGDVDTQIGDGSVSDGVISNALVENNVIYDNGLGGGSGINCDGVQNSVIRNNLIYNSHASGISLYRIDGGGGSSGNLVVNNTVLVSSSGRWALNVMDGSTNTTVRNNVFHSAHSFRGAVSVAADSVSTFVSNHNITEDRFSTDGGNSVLTLAQWRAATGEDANSFTTANPGALFVNAAGGDYHLAAGSAALDKGTTANAPSTDSEGTARPSGAGVDIGHDELAAPLRVTGVLVNGTTAPASNAASSRVTNLAVTFDLPVTAVDPGAFTLTRGVTTLTNGGAITVTGLGTTTLTLTFTGTTGVESGSLADGVWTLSTDLSKVRAGAAVGAGTATTGNIRRLYGDASGDGTVNLTDFGLFGAAFGTGAASPGYNAAFDYNGDGRIDLVDFGALGQRFGKGL